jgi:putative serine protease PepD
VSVVVMAALLTAVAGFGLARLLTGDAGDAANGFASSAPTTASAPTADSVAERTSDGASAAGTAVAGDGPVTKAPRLDPALADEPAAAVNKAVSPAVVQIETSAGLGTGFVYDTQGLILTAAHVVANSDSFGNFSTGFQRDVTVQLADGTKVAGRVLGSDLNNDIAVVKIDAVPNLPVASLALGQQPEVGSIAVAIGSPFGLDQTVTLGIISAINRPVPSPNNNLVSMLQTDAAINSGNSGGPLVNRAGQVIGVNTQIRTGSGSGANAGIGFAVPIDLAYDVAQSLAAGKPVQLGYLGVRGDDPAFGATGAMVVRVEAGSPAEKAGITVGDVITVANGRSIRSFEQLASIIRATAPGQKLMLEVQRSGRTATIEVTVGQATTR